jgi:hypothetical protein
MPSPASTRMLSHSNRGAAPGRRRVFDADSVEDEATDENLNERG